MAGRVTASIITIGNELLSGDTVNTNAAWLAQQLEELGVIVTLMASLPDEIDRIAEFVRAESDARRHRHRHRRPRRDARRRHPRGDGRRLRGAAGRSRRPRRAAALPLPVRPRVRGALGEPSRGGAPAREPARRRAGLRRRQRLRPARAPVGDEGDVRDGRRTSCGRSSRSRRGGASTRRPRRRSSACSRRWATAIRASSSARTRSSTSRRDGRGRRQVVATRPRSKRPSPGSSRPSRRRPTLSRLPGSARWPSRPT